MSSPKSTRPTPEPFRLVLIALASLLTAGCAGQSTPLPGTLTLLNNLPRVDNSPDAPCWQQSQIAAQNSYLAGIKQGKEVVYKAPCKIMKPKDQKVAAKPMMLGHPDLVAADEELDDPIISLNAP